MPRTRCNPARIAVAAFVISWIMPVPAASPDGFYDAARGEVGPLLKQVLHQIIDDHQPLPYTQPGNQDWLDRRDMDVWEALVYTDSACSDEEPNCGRIQLLYLEETRSLSQAYRGGKVGCRNVWEREHVWPKSRKFPSKTQVGYTDLHHLRPADRDLNGRHWYYGYNNGGEEVLDRPKECPGGKPVAYLNKRGDSFEPPDRAKGQVARMVFYMAVRYEPGDNGPGENMPDLFLKATNTRIEEPWIGHLCTLLDWNRKFPPTAFEKRRNDRVMELQGNRNPFIDRPSFADAIWLRMPEGKGCAPNAP